MIEVCAVDKSFGDTRALFSVNLRAVPGEIFGVVGPDGAGKSTLLRILAGTLEPDGGCVKFNSRKISENLFAYKENIAYLPQRFGLYEDLTVDENIHFFGSLFGISSSRIDGISSDLLRAADLENFRSRAAGRLSGGMKQKLGLICSLVHDPQIVILDEPTNGVDPVSRREFWAILYTLLKRKKCVIVSTSYLDEAERCSKIAMLDRGRIMEEGTPESVKARAQRQAIVLRCADTHEMQRRLIGEYPNLIRSGEYIRILSADVKGELRRLKKITGNGVLSFHSEEITLEDCLWKIVTEEKV